MVTCSYLMFAVCRKHHSLRCSRRNAKIKKFASRKEQTVLSCYVEVQNKQNKAESALNSLSIFARTINVIVRNMPCNY